MHKLITELRRLYLPDGSADEDLLARRMSGEDASAVKLVGAQGQSRALVIAFHKFEDGRDATHWERLCVVANALQADLGLPAPAVSMGGDQGFFLWLSLEQPVAPGAAQQFLELLGAAYGVEVASAAGSAALALPPCRHPDTGRWAAFIHPGLGASFVDESGLEMPPPLAGQAALLEHLQSISEQKFLQAMDLLTQARAGDQTGPARCAAPVPEGLLLKDATLEDIVNHLHALNIEPTFRHLIGKSQ